MSDQALLQRLCQGPASGQALAEALGVSRSAVWKRIEALRMAGVAIDAVPGRGYALAQPLELLDAQAIQTVLDAAALAELAALDLRFEIDSSNALALREPVPERGCRVFVCERQSTGRGSRGRVWQSPLAAHLYLTVSRRFDGGIAALQGLSLAVAVAVTQALRQLGFAAVGVKWPNDLLIDGKKLGGILIEVGGDATGPVRAAIGLGLNIAMPAGAAAFIDQPWCDLGQLAGDRPPSRNAVCAAVLNHLLPALAHFEHTGLAGFLPAWREFDQLAGQPVQVRVGGQVHAGDALGVADDGALRLVVDGAEMRVHSGEASRLRRSGARP